MLDEKVKGEILEDAVGCLSEEDNDVDDKYSVDVNGEEDLKYVEEAAGCLSECV